MILPPQAPTPPNTGTIKESVNRLAYRLFINTEKRYKIPLWIAIPILLIVIGGFALVIFSSPKSASKIAAQYVYHMVLGDIENMDQYSAVTYRDCINDLNIENADQIYRLNQMEIYDSRHNMLTNQFGASFKMKTMVTESRPCSPKEYMLAQQNYGLPLGDMQNVTSITLSVDIEGQTTNTLTGTVIMVKIDSVWKVVDVQGEILQYMPVIHSEF